jgi:hypothetical protein
MPLLYTFKAAEQSRAFVLPRNGAFDPHASRVAGGGAQPLPPALGGLAVAGMLWDVGDHASLENARPMVRGITAALQVDRGALEGEPGLGGALLQGAPPLRHQDPGCRIDRCHGQGSPHLPSVVGHGNALLPCLVLGA